MRYNLYVHWDDSVNHLQVIVGQVLVITGQAYTVIVHMQSRDGNAKVIIGHGQTVPLNMYVRVVGKPVGCVVDHVVISRVVSAL
jgi:hypothetical protein